MKNWTLGACLLGLGTLGAATAIAAPRDYQGYVCSVGYTRQPNVVFGSTGYVFAKLTTQPFCGGTMVGTGTAGSVGFIIHSAGGSALGFPFSAEERIGLMQQLHKAAKEGTKVTIRADDVGYGVWDVTFFGS